MDSEGRSRREENMMNRQPTCFSTCATVRCVAVVGEVWRMPLDPYVEFYTISPRCHVVYVYASRGEDVEKMPGLRRKKDDYWAAPPRIAPKLK